MPRKGSKKYKSNKVQQFTTWVFTLNNYDEMDEYALQELTFPHEERKVASIAWSREIGGKKKTPHLQGFIQLYKKSMLLHPCYCNNKDTIRNIWYKCS